MPQQFDNQEPAPSLTPLRSQRMTAEEAKSVIALWQQERTEQTGLTDRPALPDVAEGLGIGIEDVQRLLNQVRERRSEEERALAYEQVQASLAEEKHELDEVQRQRAELQREQAEVERRRLEKEQERREKQAERRSLRSSSAAGRLTALAASAKIGLIRAWSGLGWALPVFVASILLIIWLISVVYHRAAPPQPTDSGGCTSTSPRQRSVPCS